MILRRFMQHIKEQNWFAVGLDVIVVIVGIFLGMQVTEWNEERKLHAESEEFIQLLNQDIDLAIEATEVRLNAQLERLKDGKFFLDTYKSLNSTDELIEQHIRAIRFISFFTRPDIKVGNLGKALSAEGSSIIRDPEVREALVNFQRAYGRAQQVQDRILERIRITEVILDKYRARGLTIDHDSYSANKIPVKFDFNRIKQSDEFEYAFQNALWGHNLAVGWNEFMLALLIELKASLQ